MTKMHLHGAICSLMPLEKVVDTIIDKFDVLTNKREPRGSRLLDACLAYLGEHKIVLGADFGSELLLRQFYFEPLRKSP
jgi:hypothetical protein